MDFNTLTLYDISSWLSFALSLMMLVVSQIWRGSFMVRSAAWALITLAIGFFFAGLAPQMPLWLIVVNTNIVLLLPGVIIHSGVRAFVLREPARLDRVGAAVVVMATPLFFYWGLVEPDGMRRAVVFSVAATLIHSRSAWRLYLHQRGKPLQLAQLFMAVLFAVFSIWMALRAVHLVLTPPLPESLRAGNPTTWQTVFATNVLIAAFVASLMAAEIGERKRQTRLPSQPVDGSTPPLHDNLVLLWGIVSVVVLAILSEVAIAYLVLQQREQQQLREQNVLTNQALVQHAQQMLGQADLMLRATRDLVQKQYPADALERFTASLNTQAAFDGIYLLGPDGALLLPKHLRRAGLNASHRDYFRFHQEQAEDTLHISKLSVNPLHHKQQFHVSRRISDAQGRFAGVVMIPIEPSAFTQYYGQFMTGSQRTAALVGTQDHHVRARLPMLPQERLDAPLESPMWTLLRTNPSGNFAATSPLDGVRRQYHYQQLPAFPLVMATGFSNADVQRNTRQSIQPIALGTVLTCALLLTMAYLLTGALRRRDEQERFLSMISHELRTPMSVISMVAGAPAMPAEMGERVLRAVGNMNAIIDRALQADRLQHGHVRASGTDCDLPALCHTLANESAAPQRVKIDITALPSCKTDPQWLRVILGNLIDNALKYSPGNTPVHIQALPQRWRRQDGVAITVSNTAGHAGEPDTRQVFRKFYRAPGARGKTGSGLGLHISEGLARLLGGKLRYRSRQGKVEFTLWIPL